MALAIFDLDHTLLNGDSDYLWGEYMVVHNIVNRDEYQRLNRSFQEDYHRGELDNERYLKFALHPLTRHPVKALYQWRKDYVENWIKPIIAPKAPALVDEHRQQGDTLLIISATNFFVTEPIAELLKIPNLLATKPEIIENRYTGKYLGIPTFREGKVTALSNWLETSPETLQNSYFYSDSINDLPLLEAVSHPTVVNPDEALSRIAEQRDWPVLDLRS